MEVTSIINRSAGTNVAREQKAGRQTSDLRVDPATGPWAAGLPTPSPERTSPRISVDGRNITKSRTPWDAGGYSLPLSLDPKFFPSNTGPVIYGGDPLDSSSASARFAITPLSDHSRTTSLDWSPGEMMPSARESSTTTMRTLKSNYSGGRECQLEMSINQRGRIDHDADTQPTAMRPSFLDGHSPISPAGSPKSPRHKFSDSNSSFSSYAPSSYAPSSYAPSSQSGGHSRISSFSTVGMVQSANSSNLGEIHCIKDNVGGNGSINWGPTPVFGGSRPLSPGLGRISGGLPFRFGSFNGDRHRQRSPSDAFIGRRAHRPSLDRGHLLSQPLENVHEDPFQDRLHPLLNIRQTCSSSSRKHKRAISAPIFPHPFQPSHPHLTYNNRLLHTPPDSINSTFRQPVSYIMSSESNNGHEPGDATLPPGPAVPPTTAAGTARREANLHIPCEKDADCNTGTDRRKVISHFFGRNKKCTRCIPESVWVHWCRKHYQRERYQQGSDFSKVQAELLLAQMERIDEWSDQNVRNGETSGIVLDWELRLRKRAEDRQSRNNTTAAQVEDAGEAAHQAAALPGVQSDGTTLVPEWLVDQVGGGYSTEQMLATMNRLHDEIRSGNLVGMPDIEILPNIISDQPRRPQRQRARAPVSHRRTQSQGIPQAAAVSTVAPRTPPTSRLSNIPTSAGSTTLSSLDMATPEEMSPQDMTTSEEMTPQDKATSEDMSPQDQSRSPLQPAVETPPQRIEKRKAEENLESSMTPPNTRRYSIPHRPSANAHSQAQGGRVEQPAEQPAEHPAPSRHGRSRSDVPYPHRYDYRLDEGRDSTGHSLPHPSRGFGARNTRSVSYTSYHPTPAGNEAPSYDANLALREHVAYPRGLDSLGPSYGPIDQLPPPMPPRPNLSALRTTASYEPARRHPPPQPVEPRFELPALRPRTLEEAHRERPITLPPIRYLIREVGLLGDSEESYPARPYSAGSVSAVEQSAGSYSAGPYSAGPYSAGPYPAESSAVEQPAASYSARPYSAGSYPAGSSAVEQPAASYSAESSTVEQPAASYSAGPPSAVKQPAGSYSARFGSAVKQPAASEEDLPEPTRRRRNRFGGARRSRRYLSGLQQLDKSAEDDKDSRTGS